MVEELTTGMSLLLAAVVAGFLASWAWIIGRLVRGEELVPFSPRGSVPWGPLDLLAILIASTLIGWLVAKAYGADAVPTAAEETIESDTAEEAVDEEPEPGSDDAGDATTTQPNDAAEKDGGVDDAGQSIDEPDAAEEPEERTDPLVELQVTAISRVLSLCAALAMLLLLVRASPADVGLSRSHAPGDVWLGLVAFCAVAVPVYALQYFLAQWYPEEHPLIHTLTENRDRGLFFLAAVVAVIIAPVTEEFMFRSFLQGWLERIDEKLEGLFESFSPPPKGMFPILSTSILFAAAHIGSGPAPVPLFFLSLVLGYLYYRTHRILPCIVLHMCLNGCSMWVFWQFSVTDAMK